MAEVLNVTVQPKTAITDPDSITQALFARLKYSREVPSDDDTEGAPQTINLEGSRREELDADGKAIINVGDYANGSHFEVQIETAQGSVLWESDEFIRDANGTPTKVDVPNAVFDAAQKKNPVASPTLTRSGRFVKLDDTMPDYSGYRLFVAPIRPAQIDGTTNPQTAAVRKILGLSGNGEVTSFEVGEIDPKKLDPEAVNAVAFQTATIRVDGAFDLSIDIIGDEIEWLWLLLGQQNYVGCQLDAVPIEPRPAAIIMLPFDTVSTADATSAPATPTIGSGNTGSGTTNCKQGGVPMEYDEQQLVDHPGMFSDDPGKFCTPFENPQRILGEKRFFTVLRIDQPEIGGQGSLKVSRPILLDLAPPIKMTTVASAFGSVHGEIARTETSPLTTINAIRLNTAAAAQPRIDFRKLIDAAIFKPSRKPWTKWVRERSKERTPVSGDNPIEWDGDPTIYQAATVAGGHILEWRVQWRSNGYSLGNVAHTLTLAPRQTKRISKISWRRRERAIRRERTEAADALTQVTTRARDYTDAVQSSLSEWSKGGSKSRSTGVAGGIGFAMGPVVIGGGAAHGRASSSSWQNGGRRVAAAEQQQLRDAIRQYGESVRSLESTVITELSQEEEVEGVSETLRNVNHCHALSVLYYEILRHLRVDTSFAGVRECLYVPFSVTPFDLDKALKWRDKLRHGMLDRSLRWALDRLDEVASAWADSDIPPGRRSQHAVNHITGSVYIQLSIERLREQTEEEALDDYEQLWRPFAPLLGFPVRKIIETIRRNERERDVYFQREVAPTMASRWTDRLELVVGSNVISGADFTLASSYRFGQVVRVDFTAPIDGTLNREQLQEITIKSSQSLPGGSVANVKRMSLHYYTDHFDKKVHSDHGARDLITVGTGLPDAGAVAHFKLSAWERENLREMIERAVEKLIIHLNANLVYYHKVVWWLMDRDELYMMLDGFTAPYGRRFENGKWIDDPGRSLASVVERDPVAILGNSLVFRVAAGVFLGIDGHDSPDAAHRYYYDSQVRTEPLRVSLPTEGLYAQALMDKCLATEEHNGSTDWVLTDQDPELEAIADQLSTRRAAPENLTPTNLPDTIISLQNAPAAPDPSGLSGVLGAVTKGDSFRDRAGLSGTQANAAAAMQTAANLATSFGQKAVDFQKAKLGADTAKKKLDNIKKAESSGLIDKQEAKSQAAKVLDEQNMTPDAPPLTKDEPIQKALNNAASTGQPIEASRQTKDGFETIRVGESAEDAATPARNYIIERDDLTPEARAFNPQSHDISGVTSFSVRIRETDNLPEDAFVRWSVPPGANGYYTLAGGANVQAGKTVQITALRPGKSEIDVELRRTDGTVLESVKYPLSIPQFVSVDIDAATFTPVLTGFGLIAPEIETMLEESKRVCLTVLNTANVRTVWLMAPFNETLPAQFAGGGVAAANLTTATLKGDHPSLYGDAGIAGTPGPNSFDDKLEVYPGAFDIPVPSPNANEHLDEVTNSIVTAIKNSALTSTPEKNLAIAVLGRLIGETLAHEILHTLIGRNIAGAFHNAEPGIESDIMNKGFNRSFTSRSAFEIDTTQIAGGDLTLIITNDKDIFFINIPTGVAQAQLNTHFPVPPTFI